MPRPAEAAPVGIVGGTFDPVHLGHLRLAEAARDALGLSRVLLIPAGRPPHRAMPVASAPDRLEMLRRAAAGNPAFEIDEGELRSDAPSYTVTTLLRLREQRGAELPLVLVLGADAFRGLPSWHRWRELFGLAHIAVANRPGFPLHGEAMDTALEDELRRRGASRLPAAAAGAIVEFTMTPLAISASAIRADIAAGRSVRYLLADPVLDYIDRQHLYRTR